MYTGITQTLSPKTTNASSTAVQLRPDQPQKLADTGKLLPPAPEPADTQKASNELIEPKVLEAVAHLNSALQNLRRELHFSVDDDTGRTIVKVINSETDEIVRQIPSEEVLRLAQHLSDSGAFLLDAKA